MKDYAKAKNITLAEGDLFMSSTQIGHSQRDSKIRDGVAVPEQALIDFPNKRYKMDLYYDGEVFIYTDYKNKFIVHPNYEMKISRNKEKYVNFITATKVTKAIEFENPKYKKV